MKKIYVLALVLALIFSLAACSSSNSTEGVDAAANAEISSETPGAAEAAPTGMNGGLGNSSVDTSAIKTQYQEVPYGSISESQTLNIYLPNEGDGPFPIIVAIHGGAFKMGSATGGDVAAMLQGVNHGYAVVSLNYRLSGEAIFPAAVNDCKAAIRFIKANASTYNLNPDKIAVWGDSAGGNLAAMLGTTGNEIIQVNDNQENLEYGSAVQAVVDWFGPLDFLKMDEQFAAAGITPKFGQTTSETSPESQYIGQLISNDPELTQKSNPGTYVNTMAADTAPHFLIQHGTADANVPSQQSIDFAAQLKGVIGESKVTIELLEGAGHGTEEFTSQENLDKVFSFLDGVLK
ncbi:alpha/beta hydrolase fold domain-containing protein [Acidaminobacter sp.]|uniref:alpha/beta hydrolase fold domain-containing protein n=1 Tax=Acidaminobacter sp. TaxID=1872102 RepID=UPI0025621239|nr:alpha/beta hydrolase fold domain-containing protein [Acidaminobacter sp.]MDK9712415.1 alpha/beta hydrolase fold domain-containing protein [Acidaminobacter sp.]